MYTNFEVCIMNGYRNQNFSCLMQVYKSWFWVNDLR